MDKAKRAQTAETPKQPSLGLKLRAPYLYPDRAYSAHLPDRGERSPARPTDLVWRQGPLGGKHERVYAWLGEKKSARIRLAVMDMWKAFRLATQAHAPQTAILFDKFHVMRHLGEALDAVLPRDNQGERRATIRVRMAPG